MLQNPKFYGLDKARSWFEIEGIQDRNVRRSINDSLRKAFYKPTNFEVEDQSATMRPDKPAPKGYKDYFFWNGQTFGKSWIRFRMINLSFDLRNGKIIPGEFQVRLDPARRDSLDRTLQALAEKAVNYDGMFRNGKITGSDPLSDTVVVQNAPVDSLDAR